MSSKLFIKITLIAFTFALSLNGCGDDGEQLETRSKFSQLRDEFSTLYCKLHPLRASRLGIRKFDSLLFTFSDEEIKSSLRELRDYSARLSALEASHLEPRDLDDSLIMIQWVKGELFALEKLQNHKKNPLLFCWMAGEALYGIPSRLTAPYSGELEAYGKRLTRLPLLMDNASLLLEKPAEAHVREAVLRLSHILDEIDAIESLALERYGTGIHSLDTARESIIRFRDHLENNLAPHSHGRLLLGTENLAAIFLYDDFLEIVPNSMTDKADKKIRTLKRHLDSAAYSLNNRETGASTDDGRGTGRDPSSPDSGGLFKMADSLLACVLDLPGSGGAFGRIEQMEPELVVRDDHLCIEEIPTNPYLTVPPHEPCNVDPFITSPLSNRPCRPYIVVPSTAAGYSHSRLLYCMIKAAGPLMDVDTRLCRKGGGIRPLLTSESFRNGWWLLSIQEILEQWPAEKLELRSLLLEEMIHALCRMVVVIRLHAGSFTSNTAALYLEENTGLTPEQARKDVLLASISPSIAYPGIAIIMNDDIAEGFKGTRRGLGRTNTRVRELMIENIGLPLSFIEDRIPED